MRPALAAAAVAALVYIFGLLVAAPAGLVAAWLAPRGVLLQDPGGTIWAGRAAGAVVGELRIPGLRWELRPLALLTGAAEVDLVSAWGRGRIRVSGDSTRARDLSLKVPAVELPLRPYTGLLQPQGVFEANLGELELSSGWPVRAEGQLRWRNAGFTVADSRLGDFALELSTAEGVQGRLSDEGGPVELAGRIELMPARTYSVDLRLAARPGADAQLQQALELLGAAGPDGALRIQHRGRATDLGYSETRE